MEQRWNDIDRGKQKDYEKKTCPSAALSTTNPTWTDLGVNLEVCGEKPATNRLRYGTARAMIALMMEAVRSSETSVNFYQTTRRNIPEDSHLHTRRRENLKSHYYFIYRFKLV
jgi:membrane-bound lytic murein transglycosylase MltF